MAHSSSEPSPSGSARFRSATDFPKNIEQLDRSEADQLYTEMRDCLIFTNRSRAQLIRRNEEHKQNALQLKSDVDRLNSLIQQLNLDKQQLTQKNQQVVSDLEQQIKLMSSHLDNLTEAYEAIADIQSPAGFMAQPNRFYRFIEALKAILRFWKEEQPELVEPALPPVPKQVEAADRRENPQMHQDQASINRSLLDR